MPEPLKSFISPDLVRRLAQDIERVNPGFDRHGFTAAACEGLDGLELLARGKHLAQSLRQFLPHNYPEAVAILLRSLGPEHETDELIGSGMSSFYYLPHTIFVTEYGLGHFDLSMRAQYELTKRFTAEFSIRAFLEAEPERTVAILEDWSRDPNPHVRRLVSEGTRLRLPWGRRVAWLDRNPERVVALLERLKDDSTPLVRRSVANNLNDLGKVHPTLLYETCEAWLKETGRERRKLIEHALRSAVKRGQPDAMRLLGYGQQALIKIEGLLLSPGECAIGGSVDIAFTMRSGASMDQDLLVDLAIHFVKARGKASPKVFKLKRVTLSPGEAQVFHKRISLAVHSTRAPYPGTHAVEVLVNGVPHPVGAFEVVNQDSNVPVD